MDPSEINGDNMNNWDVYEYVKNEVPMAILKDVLS
jgi:hypothetical protein